MPLIQLSKAIIFEKKNPTTKLLCAFNPKEYTLSTSAEWKSTPTPKPKDGSPVQFTGTKQRSLKMSLIFDGNWLDYFRRGGDVANDVEQLLAWTQPKEGLTGSDPPNPPVLVFAWGTGWGATKQFFEGYLKTVSASITEFNPFGSPTRATVSVDFESVPPKSPGQNPTSGSLPGRRTHIVAAGDTLHSIAQREYGKPTYWRGLAHSNDIDDPLRVAIGTTVLIPPREDAEMLS